MNALPSNIASPPSRDQTTLVGVIYGVAAYSWWGLCPIYFKAIKIVPPLQVLAHRVVWSAILLTLLVIFRRRLKAGIAALFQGQTARILLLTSMLISINWLVFIWCVGNGRLGQASLGYFINPLVSILLGMIFLGERLRLLQWVSVGLAAGGVTYLTLAGGEFPVYGLILAFSFGFYGLLRKIVRIDALTGLTVETVILMPIALVYLIAVSASGTGALGQHGVSMDVLLLSAGVITATPLLWFANGARRLRLATMGFLQYIAPIGQAILAFAFYGEEFTIEHAITFTTIWIALIIYSTDSARAIYRTKKANLGGPVCHQSSLQE